MIRNRLHLLLIVLIAKVTLLCAAASVAQPAPLAASYKDHPLLDRFPDSEIVSMEFEENVNYRLVLSGLQRTRGQVEPENSERLRGDVTKIVYEVAQEFTGEDVYQFFSEQLLAKDYTKLFDCSGSACGSSNYWANDIFGNRILYGPVRNQYYMALRVNSELETAPHIALYITTRSNRRIYAYLEIVEVGGAPTRVGIIETSELLSQLREQGSVVLPLLGFIADNQLSDESALEQTADLLRSDPSVDVYVVAHLGGAGSLESLMRRSQARAELVRSQLVNMGIDGRRIIAQGVGPLAPACSAGNCRNRIEIVLR
ncbi:MAG: DUF4892 domain-containing protein [Proteobacteria bacterium]|nr:DUF4892 domain-containing protein [Pseudomonadota bacterium]